MATPVPALPISSAISSSSCRILHDGADGSRPNPADDRTISDRIPTESRSFSDKSPVLPGKQPSRSGKGAHAPFPRGSRERRAKWDSPPRVGCPGEMGQRSPGGVSHCRENEKPTHAVTHIHSHLERVDVHADSNPRINRCVLASHGDAFGRLARPRTHKTKGGHRLHI